MAREIDRNGLGNNPSSLPPPPHKITLGAAEELAGSQPGRRCLSMWSQRLQSVRVDRNASLWVLLREAGGWQGTPGAEMELTSLPQSQEFRKSLQRGSVSSRKANRNAMWNCPWFLPPLFSPLCTALLPRALALVEEDRSEPEINCKNIITGEGSQLSRSQGYVFPCSTSFPISVGVRSLLKFVF